MDESVDLQNQPVEVQRLRKNHRAESYRIYLGFYKEEKINLEDVNTEPVGLGNTAILTGCVREIISPDTREVACSRKSLGYLGNPWTLSLLHNWQCPNVCVCVSAEEGLPACLLAFRQAEGNMGKSVSKFHHSLGQKIRTKYLTL